MRGCGYETATVRGTLWKVCCKIKEGQVVAMAAVILYKVTPESLDLSSSEHN